MSNTRRAIDTRFIRHQCSACGDTYYLHASVDSYIDDGLCNSCYHEVTELERIYCDEDGGLR